MGQKMTHVHIFTKIDGFYRFIFYNVV